MRKSKYIDYTDLFVTIFVDYDKTLLVFVNDTGDTKAVNFDDNFFYVESLIDTYFDMISKSFDKWYGGDVEKGNKEKRKHLAKYVRHIQKQARIDLQQCDDDVKKLLGVKSKAKYVAVINGEFVLTQIITNKPLLFRSKKETEDFMWANLPTVRYEAVAYEQN